VSVSVLKAATELRAKTTSLHRVIGHTVGKQGITPWHCAQVHAQRQQCDRQPCRLAGGSSRNQTGECGVGCKLRATPECKSVSNDLDAALILARQQR